MYMQEDELPKVLSEEYRVLKPGGQLSIWDAVMPPIPTADVLLVPLMVSVSDNLTLTHLWCRLVQGAIGGIEKSVLRDG